MWVTPVRSKIRLSSEHATDFDDESLGWARFGDKPVAAGACRALEIVGAVVRSERHDGNVRCAFVCLEASRGFPPIKNRQAQVHQHHVGRVRGGVRQRILPVAGFDDLEPRQLELLSIQTSQVGLIFNQKNQGLGAHRPIIPSLVVVRDDGKVNRTIQMIVSGVT